MTGIASETRGLHDKLFGTVHANSTPSPAVRANGRPPSATPGPPPWPATNSGRQAQQPAIADGAAGLRRQFRATLTACSPASSHAQTAQADDGEQHQQQRPPAAPCSHATGWRHGQPPRRGGQPRAATWDWPPAGPAQQTSDAEPHLQATSRLHRHLRRTRAGGTEPTLVRPAGRQPPRFAKPPRNSSALTQQVAASSTASPAFRRRRAAAWPIPGPHRLAKHEQASDRLTTAARPDQPPGRHLRRSAAPAFRRHARHAGRTWQKRLGRWRTGAPDQLHRGPDGDGRKLEAQWQQAGDAALAQQEQITQTSATPPATWSPPRSARPKRPSPRSPA